LYFSINEKSYRHDVFTNPIRIDFQPIIGFTVKKNLLDFTIRIFFRYPDSDEILLDFHLQNLFEIENLNQFINGQNIIFPKEAWVTIVGLCVSHARAILFNMSAGTIYQEIMLPIANASDLAKTLFPDAFVDN